MMSGVNKQDEAARLGAIQQQATAMLDVLWLEILAATEHALRCMPTQEGQLARAIISMASSFGKDEVVAIIDYIQSVLLQTPRPPEGNYQCELASRQEICDILVKSSEVSSLKTLYQRRAVLLMLQSANSIAAVINISQKNDRLMRSGRGLIPALWSDFKKWLEKIFIPQKKSNPPAYAQLFNLAVEPKRSSLQARALEQQLQEDINAVARSPRRSSGR